MIEPKGHLVVAAGTYGRKLEGACEPCSSLSKGNTLTRLDMAGGRARELHQIERANKAAAVGRLLLGEIRSWEEFIDASHFDPNLPRRNIKAGARDVRRNVFKRINSWLARNFEDADTSRLGVLYETLVTHRGLEMALSEFESHYFKVRPTVLRGTPAHATIVISLWGLHFMFPEDFLAKDVITALSTATTAERQLRTYRHASHERALQERDAIGQLIREKAYAQRSCLHSSFSLLEAFLNGLAWAEVERPSQRVWAHEDKAYLEHCTEKSLRSRLVNVPRILTGRQLWRERDERVAGILEILKPYRDSLTHPSPFRVPEKFGGYDKLSLFYRVEVDTAILAAGLVAEAISAIHRHVQGEGEPKPGWLEDLNAATAAAFAKIEESP